MARLNLKPAASSMSHHSFNVSSITSLDLGELLPIRVIETVKKDYFSKFEGHGILRLAPQVFPTYGKCFLKTAAFFVPEYQLIETSDAFHSNMKTWKGKNVVLPHFSSTDINYLFCQSSQLGQLSSAVATNVSDPTANTVPAIDTYDFMYIDNPTATAAAKYSYNKTDHNE